MIEGGQNLSTDDFDLRGGFVIKAASGEVVVELSKLLRNLHFQDKAELVMTTFYYEPPSVHQGKDFKGDVSAAYAWASQVVEVEVDTDTGMVRMTKITGAHDVGRVLNRLGIEGQIEGGMVMGQGYALTEERILDRRSGMVMNPSLHDYKIPTMADVPQIDAFFVAGADAAANHTGARGIAEPPVIPTAPAIAAAVADAIGAEVLQIPLTPWRVLASVPARR